MPNDGGNLLLSPEDKEALLNAEPAASRWVRPFLGAEEFINGTARWCLWLVGISPHELRSLPEVTRRVQGVKAHRAASSRPSTVALANTPSLFGEIRQGYGRYVLIPRHSSENRQFVPMGFVGEETICGDSNLLLPDASAYHFGLLTSTMHNAWMRTVAGRLKSDYRYSVHIVYNNFPWPQAPSADAVRLVEQGAALVLEVRGRYPDSSLADLYDATAMPPDLQDAHRTLDRAVEAAYGYRGGKDDATRVAFLFELYNRLTGLQSALVKRPGKRKVGQA
jgi:hypothetical protein